MGIAVEWLSGNWLQTLQAAGIVSGLFFNGYALRQGVRVQQVQTLINITQQHRTIWLKLFDSPRLKRILSKSPPRGTFPTEDEREFVNLVLLHLTSILFAVRKGVLEKPAGTDADLREFFSLPIPRAVWEETKYLRDAKTIGYVEALLVPAKPIIRRRILARLRRASCRQNHSVQTRTGAFKPAGKIEPRR